MVPGMYRVDVYLRVRRAVMVEGRSIREAARVFGLHRDTVRKMLEYSVPPGYRRQTPPHRPKLEPYTGVINQILQKDHSVPKKQRHTAKRIFERLREEYGFDGGYTTVKDYVREHRRRTQEMFVPLSHAPGDAQCDFGEALVIIGGVERRPTTWFWTCPTATDALSRPTRRRPPRPSWTGTPQPSPSWAGCPRASSTTIRSWRWRRCWETDAASAPGLSPSFSPTTCSRTGSAGPARATTREKSRAWWATSGATFWCPYRPSRALMRSMPTWRRTAWSGWTPSSGGHAETIGQRMERDLEALLPLPPVAYDACDKQAGRVSSLSLVRYKTNDYSAPVAYGHRDVLVRGYVDQWSSVAGPRSSPAITAPTSGMILCSTPSTTCPCWSRRRRPWTRPLPCRGWDLPEEFGTLRRLLESRMGPRGKREFVQVLRLLETFSQQEVHAAARDAIRLGAISFDAVKHLVLCRMEGRRPRLDLELYPYLPRIRVSTTSAHDYMTLLPTRAA